MGECNWSKKRSSHKEFFFLFFLNKLFTYSNIYVLIYLFIKQQLWMSAIARLLVLFVTVQFNRQKQHHLSTDLINLLNKL